MFLEGWDSSYLWANNMEGFLSMYTGDLQRLRSGHVAEQTTRLESNRQDEKIINYWCIWGFNLRTWTNVQTRHTSTSCSFCSVRVRVSSATASRFPSAPAALRALRGNCSPWTLSKSDARPTATLWSWREKSKMEFAELVDKKWVKGAKEMREGRWLRGKRGDGKRWHHSVDRETAGKL